MNPTNPIDMDNDNDNDNDREFDLDQKNIPEWEKSIKRYSRVLLTILVVLVIGIIYHMFYQMPEMYAKYDLQSTFRDFWCNDSKYMSMFIVANLNNLPNLKFVGDRIIQNYADMTQILVKIHGLDADTLFPLLQEHAAFVATLVDFRKNNGLQNSSEYQNMYLEWKKNTKLIAVTISGLRKTKESDKLENEFYNYLEKISHTLEAELSNVPNLVSLL